MKYTTPQSLTSGRSEQKNSNNEEKFSQELGNAHNLRFESFFC